MSMVRRWIVEREGGMEDLSPLPPFPKGKGEQMKRCPVCGVAMTVQRVPIQGVWKVAWVCEYHGPQEGQ